MRRRGTRRVHEQQTKACSDAKLRGEYGMVCHGKRDQKFKPRENSVPKVSGQKVDLERGVQAMPDLM